MDIQSILLNANQYDPNLLAQTPTVPQTETIDLEAIARQAYEAEMAKYQTNLAEVQAQALAAQNQAAALSSAAVATTVPYTPEDIAALQAQALAQLQQQAMAFPTSEAIAAVANPVPQPNWNQNIPVTPSVPNPNWNQGVPNNGGFVMPTGAQLETVYKIIAAEGGSTNPQEAVNIASTMINRARSGGWSGGNNIYNIATAPNQYVVYQNGQYQGAALSPESRAAVDQLFSISANGGSTAHNFQSFRSHNSTSYGGSILTPGGNRYK